MAKAESIVEELVSKIERGELRLPEMQRRYVWRSTRVRDLLDSFYRFHPSVVIATWGIAWLGDHLRIDKWLHFLHEGMTI